MSIESWIGTQVFGGKDATISVALLEKSIPSGLPSMSAIKDWASAVCRKFGCEYSIHFASDVITFYPISKH